MQKTTVDPHLVATMEEAVGLRRQFDLAPERAIRDAVIWAYKDGLGNPQPSTQDEANGPAQQEIDPPAEGIRDFTIVRDWQTGGTSNVFIVFP